MQISQVIRIWRVTLVSLYFQLHLRLSPVFTRILVKSLSPATAFCLMKTILFQRTFYQEEKQNTGCRSIQICHQTNYVCVCMCVCVSVCVCVHAWWFWINFSTYSDSPVIWCNSKAQKNVKKILVDILWNFFSEMQFAHFKKKIPFKFNKMKSSKVRKIQFCAIKIVVLMFFTSSSFIHHPVSRSKLKFIWHGSIWRGWINEWNLSFLSEVKKSKIAILKGKTV